MIVQRQIINIHKEKSTHSKSKLTYTQNFLLLLSHIVGITTLDSPKTEYTTSCLFIFSISTPSNMVSSVFLFLIKIPISDNRCLFSGNLLTILFNQCHLDKVFYDENSISYAVMH